MQVPIGAEDSFVGVVDLLTEQAILFEDELGSTPEYTDVPENMRDLVKEKRAEMVERIAELNDDLTLKYLEGEELTIEEMKAALRRGVLNNEVSQYLLVLH